MPHRPVQRGELTAIHEFEDGITDGQQASREPLAAAVGRTLGVDLDQAAVAIRKPPPQALRPDAERPCDGVHRADLGALDGFVERRAATREAATALFVATGGTHGAQLCVAVGETAVEDAGREAERPLDLGDGAAGAFGDQPVQGTAQPGVALVTDLARLGGEDPRW